MTDPLQNKAFLKIVSSGAQIPCMFNPAELSVARTNRWEAGSNPGQGVKTLQYRGANSGTLSLNLTFDTTDTGDPVTNYTDKLLALMDIDTSLSGTDENSNNARPPTVTFNWGSLQFFEAVVASVNLQFTYFSSTGVPLRAKASVSLTQYIAPNTYGPQNPTSGTPSPHRVHRVQPGETLDRISSRYYGDATRWRQIATANGISDPLALRPGALLSIPRMS